MNVKITSCKALTLLEIKELLKCNVVWAEEDHLGTQIERAGAADLMSDVLAFTRQGSLMLTGLVNIQSVRTADIAEVRAIIYVRGKTPTPDT
ncbi:MAG: hypothetical protein A2Y62_17640, partial [Candidatus Fischerbacteria bacterium RBG_13_37_8]